MSTSAMMRTLSLLALALTGTASAQRIGIGLKLGALATDPFSSTPVTTTFAPQNFERSTRYTPGDHRLTLGPMIEFRLPRNLAVEVDVLFRPMEYLAETRVRDIVPGPFLPFDQTLPIRTRARNLDVPVLAKYRFSQRPVRPFMGVGGAARRVFSLAQAIPTNIGFVPLPGVLQYPPPSELTRKWTGGFVAAAGLEWRIWKLRIAPELRYYRWASSSFRSMEGGFFSKADQLEVLFSLGF